MWLGGEHCRPCVNKLQPYAYGDITCDVMDAAASLAVCLGRAGLACILDVAMRQKQFKNVMCCVK